MYGHGVRDSLNAGDVDQRISNYLASYAATNDYAPRSIPQISVNIPLVTALPQGTPDDGTEVYLEVDATTHAVAHMLYLRSIPGWIQVGQAPIVTAIPTTALVEGLQLIYDTGTAGVRWQFVYDTSDGTTYPWMFIGGPALSAEVATQETTTSATYVALATAGPTVTLPLAGDYDVSHGSTMTNNIVDNDCSMSYDIGGTAAATADAVFVRGATAGSAPWPSVARTKRKAGLTAVALTCKYQTNAGATATIKERWISATPIRVGA